MTQRKKDVKKKRLFDTHVIEPGTEVGERLAEAFGIFGGKFDPEKLPETRNSARYFRSNSTNFSPHRWRETQRLPLLPFDPSCQLPTIRNGSPPAPSRVRRRSNDGSNQQRPSD